ncbi:putative retrotransposon hot spot protein 4 (RHS4) [Trypanosoma vivax]|nr:putative retrotransposon hot spot protein 4 (RHS4) [Trypanosoma vivax]
MLSVFRHSLRFAGVRHARVSAHVRDNQLRVYHRTLPFLCRAASGSTGWTLNSDVADVLLRGARPPEEVLLSECLERVRHRGTDIDGNVRMDVVIQRPERFIPDADLREMILSLPECQTYALVYRAVPLLRGKGITSVRRWGGADENADAKRAVRDELADERLWNTVSGLLDDAFSVAKDAEARGKIVKSKGEAAKVIPGAFESVLNARWSHVLSGVADKPLGMCVADGRPTSVWSDAEVNKTPLQLPTENVDDARGDGLELLVLTSAMGWPFTLFNTDTAADGTPFQMMDDTDVVVRRESVRVWNIVRADLDAWLVRKERLPTPFVLVGSPGIGKSFGVGSHLLYELLHYAPGKLDVVTFLVREEIYIFYLPSGGEAGRVECYDKTPGVRRIKGFWRAGKRGYMILDAKKDVDLPSRLPARSWGSIVLSSPNKKNYRVWRETNMGSRFLFINRYHAREMKAYFAWMRRTDLAAAEGNAAVRAELEESWRVMEERMHEVGHAPRYVFNYENYETRKEEAEAALNTLITGNVSYFLRVFAGSVEWKNDGTTHSLVDLVRLEGGATERCGNRPVSVAVRSKMIDQLHDIVASDPRIFNPEHYATINGIVFEILVLAALQRPASAWRLLQGTRALDSGARVQRRSVVETVALASIASEQFTFRRVGYLYNSCRPEVVTTCEPMVLYRNYHDDYPVIDGFFVVDGHPGGTSGAEQQRGAPQRTVVLLQVTLAREHPTDTNKLMLLMKALRAQFSNWEDFTRNAQWEMIYFLPNKTEKMRNRQRCSIPRGMEGDAGHKNAHEFWNTKVRQYQKSVDETVLFVRALLPER